MERKLAEFRARRKAQSDETKPKAERMICREVPLKAKNDEVAPPAAVSEIKPPTCLQTSNKKEDAAALWDGTRARGLQRLASHLTLLKVLLWLVLLGLFAELEFGLPFFLISLFYWLYEGLRSPKAKQPGEMSAYSVFNPHCEPILGTLTAEQLEGEMGYRAIANR
ncbi:hypothetical protein DNTS_016133 [Danionella cerebrum]|uniref:SAYSvFN domain-containing protein n=1 Tax=Danionella cerebrum TaxID=2873325 RepID=A0A553Q8S2_9TELE|nr:hypothetical protein DNTS_016133 [Danionella translucida]